MSAVTCEAWREALSAMVDGETPHLDARLVEAHVARCAGCRQFRTAAEQARRLSRVHVAEPIPDLSRRVSKLAAISDRAGSWSIVRALLLVVAVQIMVWSLPGLVLGDETGASTHSARHLGAFTFAYGVGLVVVFLRPARARTMLPVTFVLAGAQLLTAVVDLIEGRIPLVNEIQHLPEVLSVIFVWLLAVPSPRRGGRTHRHGFEPRPLEIVEDQRDVG